MLRRLATQTFFRSFATNTFGTTAYHVWHPIKDTFLPSFLDLLTTNARNSQASINTRIFEERHSSPTRKELKKLIPDAPEGIIDLDSFQVTFKREGNLVFCKSDSYDHNHRVSEDPLMMTFHGCVVATQSKVIEAERRAQLRLLRTKKPTPDIDVQATLRTVLKTNDFTLGRTPLNHILVFNRELGTEEKKNMISQLRELRISVLGNDTDFTPSAHADRIVLLNSSMDDVKRLLSEAPQQTSANITAPQAYRPR